jgi:Family of unknown function (DUF5906)
MSVTPFRLPNPKPNPDLGRLRKNQRAVSRALNTRAVMFKRNGRKTEKFNCGEAVKAEQWMERNRDDDAFLEDGTALPDFDPSPHNRPPQSIQEPEPTSPAPPKPAAVQPSAKPTPPEPDEAESEPEVVAPFTSDQLTDDEVDDSEQVGDGAGSGGDEQPQANDSVKEAREQAKKKREEVLAEFNKRYAVVNDAGAALIFCDDVDQVLKRRVYRRMTPGALRTLYLNRHVCSGITDEGERRYTPVAEFWLKHSNRRQYIGGVTFDPSHASDSADILNLWRGFSVKPKKGSWQRLKHHIRAVLCQGDETHFNYLMGWMARLVQFPAEPGEVAIVLRGNIGTGKGTVGHALLALFRQHGMHISSSKHLVGSFNAHLRDCVLLFADEAFFAGDKASLGVLKAIITERVLTIEAKHMNAIQCPNMLHIIMASNSDWVVPAALDERRFFVLDVSDAHKQDKPYFASIKRELESGGYEAMLHDLQHYNLSGFEVRDVPETKALQDQKKQSLENKYAWWREVLARGYVYRSKLGLEEYFATWHEFATTDLLFDSYRDFAKETGERHPMNREMLGKFLRDFGCKQGKPGESVIGEHLVPGGADLILKRKPGYRLGSLDEARDAFERRSGLAIEWGDVD